ncbi:MAG: DUF423 domain-containing protein [Flavobacteriales bacterium]|jgi:uncharacterized membrane protein YgdD (TMEM256/DUF423 family)|nr:DUF423 domain-containing protein [Flavobacteriales bacterium]MBT6013582.1 DUF423 domain-containing protein [Flavobacteriales bacterium]MBT7481179.1 DUF423 domain-containing protein [Flavobacteriales bacterium]
MTKFIKVSLFFCVTSVVLGAFGAHLLKDLLTENQIVSFQTGIRYQMFHGLSILILSLNKDYFTDKLNIDLQLMSVGVILFSLSIYLLNLQDLLGVSLSFLGPITPLGGLFLIGSWSILLFSVKKNSSSNI